MLALLPDSTRRKQGNSTSGKDSPREHLLPYRRIIGTGASGGNPYRRTTLARTRPILTTNLIQRLYEIMSLGPLEYSYVLNLFPIVRWAPTYLISLNPLDMHEFFTRGIACFARPSKRVRNSSSIARRPAALLLAT